ncbi:MAG: hypothetical protein VYE64_11810 [Planctomycetota bacterium]|jgi:hypothetical protein|nr:hypothetical protein [Planctomycetota bacterium]
MIRKRGKSKRSGFKFILIQGLLIAGLLLLNGLLVRAFILANQPVLDTRISQAIQFIGPLLMIFAQLWVYDFLTSPTVERD